MRGFDSEGIHECLDVGGEVRQLVTCRRLVSFPVSPLIHRKQAERRRQKRHEAVEGSQALTPGMEEDHGYARWISVLDITDRDLSCQVNRATDTIHRRDRRPREASAPAGIGGSLAAVTLFTYALVEGLFSDTP